MKTKYAQPRTLKVNYRFPVQFDKRLTEFATRTGMTKTKVMVNATQCYLDSMESIFNEKTAEEKGKANSRKAAALCP